MALYAKGDESNLSRWVEEEASVGTSAAFQSYGMPAEALDSFKYLGRVLTASNNDWLAVLSNLRKDRWKWERFYRIWGQDGADAWTSGTFYKSVIEATLFFGSETWVMNPRIEQTLRGFHYRVDLCIAGMQSQRNMEEQCEYLPLEAAIAAELLEDVET